MYVLKSPFPGDFAASAASARNFSKGSARLYRQPGQIVATVSDKGLASVMKLSGWDWLNDPDREPAP